MASGIFSSPCAPVRLQFGERESLKNELLALPAVVIFMAVLVFHSPFAKADNQNPVRLIFGPEAVSHTGVHCELFVGLVEEVLVSPCCLNPYRGTQCNIGRNTARAPRKCSSVSAKGLPGSCIRAAPRRWVLHRGWECPYTRPYTSAYRCSPIGSASLRACRRSLPFRR